MGNTLNNEEQTLKKKHYRSKSIWFEDNLTLSKFAKHGEKITSSSAINLCMKSSTFSSSKISKFLHSQRKHFFSLRNMTAIIDRNWIMPFLYTRLSLRGFLKSVSRRLASLKYLQRFQLRCSTKVEGIDITLHFLKSLSKLKKLRAISIDVTGTLERNTTVGKAIKCLKYLTRLDLNFMQKPLDIYETVQALKYCSSLQVLRLNLSSCKFDTSAVFLLGDLAKSLKGLQYLIINMSNTSLSNQDLESLIQVLDKSPNLVYIKLYTIGCKNLSWYLKAKLYARERFDLVSKIC